ncbi:hypothetical protein [Halobacillus sp. A5]|uniref:hypothetical protein n=1 Tax=Halobacillus sp. A5 TaxID=2880263 RepID=UPI0020A69C88|nr:hypothetical protein [Halobacillus sp. A5]MCP3028304.1 hypothetical protein [Halobacillus sp. A5]
MRFLSKEEELFLHERFRYFLDDEDEVYEIIKGTRLKTKSGVQQTIDCIYAYMESNFLITSASILSKRYGYYIANVPLAAMTLFDKLPQMDLENIELMQTTDEQKWFPKLKLKSKKVSEPGKFNRQDWMNAELSKLFSNQVRPLFLHINQLTRLSMNVMWENIAIYMFRFYERELPQWYDSVTARRMQKDLLYIIGHLPGSAFGTKENPFGYFINQPIMNTGARQRKCCCLSYKLHCDSNFCKVCPHLRNS